MSAGDPALQAWLSAEPCPAHLHFLSRNTVFPFAPLPSLEKQLSQINLNGPSVWTRACLKSWFTASFPGPRHGRGQ